MGYRIDFSVGGGVLSATISGAAGLAGHIARDISDQARASSVQHVLIDVRRLKSRFGRLRTLLASHDAPRRIAVLDSWENDSHYVFLELAARSLGCELRRFDHRAEALEWLSAPEAA